MLFTQVIVNGLATGAFLALIAIGLTLIFSILRVVNFMHGILFMLGAYGVYFLTDFAEMPYFLAIAISGIGIGIFGILLDILVFRRFHGMLLEGAVIAVGLALLFESLAWEIFSGSPQSVSSPLDDVLTLGSVVIAEDRLFVIVSALVLVALLHGFVRWTRYGKAMRAMQQEPYAARLQGIELNRLSMITFGLSAGLAGLAGGLMAPLQSLLPNMGTSPMLMAFVVIILGGMGSIAGALCAAFIVGLTQSIITTYWAPQAALGMTFLVAIIILMVRPKGLFGHE